MRIFIGVALVLAMGACSSRQSHPEPPLPERTSSKPVPEVPKKTRTDWKPQHSEAILSLLIDAKKAIVQGGGVDLRAQRLAIEAHCDNLMYGSSFGYRGKSRGSWDMRQGSLYMTNRQLDMAIDGQGFFRLQLPDNTTAFTRAGVLNVDADGNVVTAEGYLLDPPLTIPENITGLFIDTNGLVQGLDPNNPKQLQQIGQLSLTRFINPGSLTSTDGVLFRETHNTGERIDGEPGQGNGFGLIRQGFVEESNVNVLETAVTLVAAVRRFNIAFEAWKIKQSLK